MFIQIWRRHFQWKIGVELYSACIWDAANSIHLLPQLQAYALSQLFLLPCVQGRWPLRSFYRRNESKKRGLFLSDSAAAAGINTPKKCSHLCGLQPRNALGQIPFLIISSRVSQKCWNGIMDNLTAPLTKEKQVSSKNGPTLFQVFLAAYICQQRLRRKRFSFEKLVEEVCDLSHGQFL